MPKTTYRLYAVLAAASLVFASMSFAAASAQGGGRNNGSALCPLTRNAYTIRAIPPEMPEVSREQFQSGTVELRVTIASNGSVSDVTVGKSSGNRLLDKAAMQAARASEFAPEVRDCELVGGSYLYIVDFPSTP